MSAKKGRRKIETRTLLYILIAIVIISAAYTYISSLPAATKYYSVESVLSNKENYIGKTITIKAYYDADLGIVDDIETVSSGAPTSGLKIDSSNLDNTSKNNLIENKKLHFAGHLEYIDPKNELIGVIFTLDEVTPA